MYFSKRSTGSSTCPSASITLYVRDMENLPSDDPLAAEGVELGGTVAEQPAVHLGVVLAEQRRPHHLGGRVRQAHRVRGHRVRAAPGMLKIDDEAARFQMGVRQHLSRVEHGTARDAGAGQDLHHLVLRALTPPP